MAKKVKKPKKPSLRGYRLSKPKFAQGDTVCCINSSLLTEKDMLSRTLPRRSLIQSGTIVMAVPSSGGTLYNVRVGRSHVVVNENYVAQQTERGEAHLLRRVIELQLESALNHLLLVVKQSQSVAENLDGCRLLLESLEEVALRGKK